MTSESQATINRPLKDMKTREEIEKQLKILIEFKNGDLKLYDTVDYESLKTAIAVLNWVLNPDEHWVC